MNNGIKKTRFEPKINSFLIEKNKKKKISWKILEIVFSKFLGFKNKLQFQEVYKYVYVSNSKNTVRW